MPSRVHKAKKRVDCTPVQGEGSWVLLRTPGWEDYKRVLDGRDPTATNNQMDVGMQLITGSVEAWNWVDDDDQPLPTPTPELVASLPLQELTFLITALDLKEYEIKQVEKRKNSRRR